MLALVPGLLTEPEGRYIWCDGTVVDWVNGSVPGPCYNTKFRDFESFYAYYRKLFGNFW